MMKWKIAVRVTLVKNIGLDVLPDDPIRSCDLCFVQLDLRSSGRLSHDHQSGHLVGIAASDSSGPPNEGRGCQ